MDLESFLRGSLEVTRNDFTMDKEFASFQALTESSVYVTAVPAGCHRFRSESGADPVCTGQRLLASGSCQANQGSSGTSRRLVPQVSSAGRTGLAGKARVADSRQTGERRVKRQMRRNVSWLIHRDRVPTFYQKSVKPSRNSTDRLRRCRL